MATALQFENGRSSESALTPELRDFIDRCLVPILVRDCLAEIANENSLALSGPQARNSHSTARRSASGGSR